jgi:hypothetical protein
MVANLNPQPAKQAAARAYNTFNLAAMTVGAKVTNTINVAVQLQDARGQAVKQIGNCSFYLSDNADGSTLTATATSSALAIGTNGVLMVINVTGKYCDVITNASGQFDLNIIQTAGGTKYYPVVMMPDGSIIVGGAIQF